MKVRYKAHPKTIRHCTQFNIHAMNEVLTGDDSAYISDLDIEIEGQWKDMQQAFRDKDIIPDNYNQSFGPPLSYEYKIRGWNP